MTLGLNLGGLSLPRGVGVTKVNCNARVVGHILVQRHLTTLVVGHALEHGVCHAEHVWNLPTPVLSFASGYTFVSCMAKACIKFFLSSPTGWA